MLLAREQLGGVAAHSMACKFLQACRGCHQSFCRMGTPLQGLSLMLSTRAQGGRTAWKPLQTVTRMGLSIQGWAAPEEVQVGGARSHDNI